MADRYAAILLPVTLVVAGAAWALSGDPVRALAVLVVATPCPLILAAPVALISGVSRAARRGVIAKGGGTIEKLGRARPVLFDKTGTLTHGRPEIERVSSADGLSSEELLKLGASVDQLSAHVLAEALVHGAEERGIELAFPEDVVEEPGQGIEGRVAGHRVAVGSSEWLRRRGYSGVRNAAELFEESDEPGLARVLIGVDGELAGAVLMADRMRDDAGELTAALRSVGVERVALVTGDQRSVGEAVGRSVGVDRVFAECSPEEKIDVVREARELTDDGGVVMVGDGVNDAPALALADVGIAMGGVGATVSSETADAVIAVDRVDRVVDALRIGRRSLSIARQSVLAGLGLSFVAIEQAQVFALQRCATAREAVKLIGALVETHGFLPSCGGSEALCIADPRELWTMEICSVGPEWAPGGGKPGAIWAARRVPDDHVVVIANYFRIRELDLKSPDTLASPNVVKEAIDRGWYDPKSGRPFVWQEAYAPPIMEGNLSRMWLVSSALAPSLKAWPRRALADPASPRTIYAQPFEGAAFYPWSFKPERKISVQDIIAFQRSAFEDTIYDMTWDPAWMVPAGGGRLEKSPMASPYVSADLEKVLRVRHHRTIAGQGYGMVAQLRSWLPDAVGGVYWVYVDNPKVGPYVPIYAGVTDVSPLYKTYDFREFSEDSARWAYDFVEKLALLRWQPALRDIEAARAPLERSFFADQAAVEAEAASLLESDPAAAAKYLTDLTVQRMEKLVALYRSLRKVLLTKYSGDGV